jgi:hypothetical protein
MSASEADRLTAIRERQCRYNIAGNRMTTILLTVEERDWLVARLDALTQEAENERMKLAACMTAALSNTTTTVAERLTSDHPYHSASYADICRAVDREMTYRAQCDALTAERDDERRFAAQAVVTLQEAEATVARLTEEIERERRDSIHELETRDLFHEWADKLAYALFDVSDIGEHSSGNNPWAQALERLEDIGEQLEQAEARAAAAEMDRDYWKLRAHGKSHVEALERAAHGESSRRICDDTTHIYAQTVPGAPCHCGRERWPAKHGKEDQ